MANILIAWGNDADRATLSGGAWVSTLPRTNLQTRELARVARSTSAATAATKFTATFAGRPPLIDCIVLVAHNLSAAARWKVTASNAAGSKVRSTGWMDVWKRSDPAELEWEDDRWWSGLPDAETIAAFTPLLVWTGGRKLWPSADDVTNPATWTVEIDDSTNPAGYVQFGRLFMGRAFQPKYNYEWGSGLGYETETTVDQSLDGVEFFGRRPPVRIFNFRLGNLNDAEAYGAVLLLQRTVGIDGEVVVIPDPGSSQFSLQRNIYGRLRRLSLIENPHYQTHGHAYEVKEIIA
ncbi:hypothetical protein [uncultured Azohydromonas sp.]|jgi:hypothetical protein|uniref:hypothetical protein n=1 Tax=uncultured Azohydromonas sp. TaxID=487342 RepID=UPI0026175918|nr:hypothetical protein [uncultured Azohydromonas sp.]